MSALYIVPTPIGNLGDLTGRAVRTLRDVDFIAAEDTRVTRKLLSHLGVKKQLVSYYEHNSRTSGTRIAARIASGETCALVTDAGTPAISDPGAGLIQLCAEQGIPVVALPGPCAAVTALSASGMPGGRFCFEGYLSINKKNRRAHLDTLRNERRVMVFYEAPHKLLATLSDLLATLGDRPVVICREMTKLHEEIMRTTLKDAADHFTQTAPRGEFVLILSGAPTEKIDQEIDMDAAVSYALSLIEQGETVRDAVRQAAELTGAGRRLIYAEVVQSQDSQ